MRKVFLVLLFSLVIVNVFLIITFLLLKNNTQEIISSIETETTAESVKNKKVSVVFTGDVMLGRSVMATMQEKQDYRYPFLNTFNLLIDADITFINLENPIVTGCPTHTGGFTFCTPPEATEGLIYAGVDIVTLANNHTLNYGTKGLEETMQVLDKANIKMTGIGKLMIIEKKDATFGFLGFDYVTPGKERSDIELVKESDAIVDVLIVSPHWGEEYKSSANSFQRQKARELISAGADLIVGHHPHWVQDSELIEGKPVYYSLGNFIFDQMWSEETKKGMVLKITFVEGKIIGEERFNTYIRQIGQPELSQN